MSRPIIVLADKVGWFGAHTGYELLPSYLKELCDDVQVISPQAGIVPRLIGKTYSLYRKWPPRNQAEAAAELHFWRMGRKYPDAVQHILYLENHLCYLDCWEKAPRNLIGTIHQPPSQWSDEALDYLKRLSSAIVLYQRDLAFFEQHIGMGRVKFIHYGTDIHFFQPAPPQIFRERRLLYAGVHLRNSKMLHRVIARLAERYPELRFDLLVPERRRSDPGLSELQQHPGVTWHEGLSDEQLRGLYQSSYLMVLPMNASGANTAVVEALACGLPIATTDVGGIRDYGGGTVYPIVDNDDDEAMLTLIEQYLNDNDWRNHISQECRKFSEQNSDWTLVAQKHLRIYNELTAS